MNEDNVEIKEVKDPFTHDIKFLSEVDESKPYISYTFNVLLTDELLMFHICHLYHNCIKLIEAGEMEYSEIDSIITLEYILKSVQEALDNRIKCLSASYIDDNYKWCFERPHIFDICLGYFSKIKNKLKELNQQQNINKNETCEL